MLAVLNLRTSACQSGKCVMKVVILHLDRATKCLLSAAPHSSLLRNPNIVLNLTFWDYWQGNRQGKSNQFNGLDIFMAANDTAVGHSQKNAGYMTLYTVKRANGSFAVNCFRFIHVCFVLVVVCNVRQFILE